MYDERKTSNKNVNNCIHLHYVIDNKNQ